MTKKGKMILQSMCDLPPTFVPDFSIYRNCYAHALNCMYEDRDYSVYSPGLIAATISGADIFFTDRFFFDEDLFLKSIKRDCFALSRSIASCSYDSKIDDNAYKIVATYSEFDHDFHFLRQNANGLWSHKPGWGAPLFPSISEIIDYRGESHIDFYGVQYKVVEIFKLQQI